MRELRIPVLREEPGWRPMFVEALTEPPWPGTPIARVRRFVRQAAVGSDGIWRYDEVTA